MSLCNKLLILFVDPCSCCLEGAWLKKALHLSWKLHILVSSVWAYTVVIWGCIDNSFMKWNPVLSNLRGKWKIVKEIGAWEISGKMAVFNLKQIQRKLWLLLGYWEVANLRVWEIWIPLYYNYSLVRYGYASFKNKGNM